MCRRIEQSTILYGSEASSFGGQVLKNRQSSGSLAQAIYEGMASGRLISSSRHLVQTTDECPHAGLAKSDRMRGIIEGDESQAAAPLFPFHTLPPNANRTRLVSRFSLLQTYHASAHSHRKR